MYSYDLISNKFCDFIIVERLSDNMKNKLKRNISISFISLMIASSLSSVCISAFSEAYIDSTSYFSRNSWKNMEHQTIFSLQQNRHVIQLVVW